VPPTEAKLPAIPASAYAAALKEYEDMEDTDSEGDDLSWWFRTSNIFFEIVSIFWIVYYIASGNVSYYSIALFSNIMWYSWKLYGWYLLNIVYISLCTTTKL
jgi:hypothetical protein